MHNSMLVYFHLNYRKPSKKNGKFPVLCRVTVNKKRIELVTKIYLLPDHWNQKLQISQGLDDLSDLYNMKLNHIRVKLETIYLDFEKKGEVISEIQIKNAMSSTGQVMPDILPFFKRFIKSVENNQSQIRAVRTVQTYQTRLNLLSKYLRSKSVKLSEINEKWAINYLVWMKSNNCCHNYAMKNIQALKAVLKYAVKLEILTVNPLEYFEFNFQKNKKLIYLEYAEVEKLRYKVFSQTRLQQVADLFLLQCYTGLAYADLVGLDSSKIYTEMDKQRWIIDDRQKSGTPAYIPLLPGAECILKKYNEKLPIISNQKYNSYLKEIADILGMTKKLTSHVGRKTCGTLMLERGYSIEVVSKVLGHKSVKMTESIYAQVTMRKIKNEIRNNEIFLLETTG
jgi:site-specific recombinase XerD